MILNGSRRASIAGGTLKLLIVASIALMANKASAQFMDEQVARLVVYVSVDDWSGQGTSPAVGSFALDGPLALNCHHGVVYFTLGTLAGRGWLATLLMAKTARQRVRPAYVLESDGRCLLRRIVLAD
jgi:hypothetical protein